MLSEAANTQARLKTLHDKQENSIKQLQEARKGMTSTFQDMRERFNQILDKVEKDSTTQMNSLLTMLKEQVTLDKEVFLYFHDKIKKLLDDIKILGDQCDEVAFQGYKKCCEENSLAEKLLSSMEYKVYNLQFSQNANIEQHLSTLESFGTFYVTSSEKEDKEKNKTSAPQRQIPKYVRFQVCVSYLMARRPLLIEVISK